MDRAPWHKGQAVREFVSHHSRLEVVFFPPACPDLTPQEHLWKMTRQAVSHNHTFSNFPALCNAFRDFLKHTTFHFDCFTQLVPPVLRQFVFGWP
jgi:transposase